MSERLVDAIWSRRHPDTPYRPGRPRHDDYRADYRADVEAVLAETAEVLAEMPTEALLAELVRRDVTPRIDPDAFRARSMRKKRLWMCWQYGTSEKFQHCRHDEQGMADEDGMVCGWYRVVKEAEDG
jgi:hypothetical protein